MPHSCPTRRPSELVIRNRARRRLRAVVADVLSARAEPGCDYVLIARAATADRSYDDLLRDLGKALDRSEEHTSELPSLMRISYAVFCLDKNKKYTAGKQQHPGTHPTTNHNE